MVASTTARAPSMHPCPHARVQRGWPPSSYTLRSTLLNDAHAPQAQRVIGCAAPRSGSALTQRWATTTRSCCVGNPLADLPSGEL